MELELSGFDGYTLSQHLELYSDNLNETNDKDNERVKPNSRSVADNSATTLKKHSWNMLVFKK
ncbi:MAG: hypothetical protein IJ039_06930 [Clostridia bacterium]|nr:hypothetical protein [Clostridia bacterium]